MTKTLLTDLIDPQVISQEINNKFPTAMKFKDVATVNNELEGRAGSTLLFPAFKYIGEASDVAEGEAISLDKLVSAEKEVKVLKSAKGVELTDEAVLSGAGDPVGSALEQLTASVADRIDSALLEVAKKATQSYTATGFTVEELQNATDILPDNDDVKTVIFMNKADAGKLRLQANKDFLAGSEIGAEALINGTYGEVLGVQIVRTNKVEKGSAILVQEGGLGLAYKRDVQVESDRDITTKSTVITADAHYGAYLYDETKVVNITVTAGA